MIGSFASDCSVSPPMPTREIVSDNVRLLVVVEKRNENMINGNNVTYT